MREFFERLAIVIHWICILISFLFVYFALFEYEEFFIIAVLVFSFGWTIKYIITGDGKLFPFRAQSKNNFSDLELETFARCLSDYQFEGERVLIGYPVEGIPLDEEINSLPLFSKGKKKSLKKIKQNFVCGVIYGFAYYTSEVHEKDLEKFIKAGFKKANKVQDFNFNLLSFKEYSKSTKDYSFRLGITFAETFMTKFQGLDPVYLRN